MNICIINVDSRPEFIGGIKRVSSTLAGLWQEAGHSVYFMSLCRSDIRLSEIAGIPQFILPDTSDESGDENLYFFVRFIRERQIDIVLNQHLEERGMTTLCVRLRKSVRIEVVSAYHFAPTHELDIVDSSFFVPISLSNPIKRYVMDSIMISRWWLWRRAIAKKKLISYFKYCLENCDRMVLLSNGFKLIMNDMTAYMFKDKIKVINNPVIFEAEIAVPSKSNTVIWCGRVGYDAKRVDRMLSIWEHVGKKHPDWECLIIGSGNIEYFKKAVVKYGINNVHFLGFCDPHSYYKTGAVLCVTSSVEGWSLAIIEAMAHGCVPIAYDSYASLHDIITDGENGFAIPAFDEDAYIRKLELLMNNNVLRSKMAAKVLSNVHRFDSHRIAGEWIELFENLRCR